MERASEEGEQRDGDFSAWLENHKLHSYKQALAEEGYEGIESLTLLSDEEIEELSRSVNMKPGHKKTFPVAIEKARQGMKEHQREKELAKELAQELTQELAKIERGRKLAEARDGHTNGTDNPPKLASVDEAGPADRKSTDLATLTPGKYLDPALPREKELELPSSKRWQVTITQLHY